MQTAGGCLRGLVVVVALEVEGRQDGAGVEGWWERLGPAVVVIRVERDGDSASLVR